MTYKEKKAGHDNVWFGVEWNEKYVSNTKGSVESMGEYTIKPEIWRWDRYWTGDWSAWSETLSKDPNNGGGSQTWSGLSYTSGSGYRKIDTFEKRTYKLGNEDQKISITITTTGDFRTSTGESYTTVGAKTITFEWTLPSKKSVAKVPEWKPCNVVLKRGNDNAMDLKWTVPLHLRDKDSGFTDVAWIFQASKNMNNNYKEVRLGATYPTADKLWVRDLGLSTTSHAQEYNRDMYHPVYQNRYLTKVTASVLFYDWTANHPLSTQNQTTVSYTFQKPLPPEWEEPTFDTGTKKASCVLKVPDDEKDYANERYHTEYWVTRKDNLGGTYSSEKFLISRTTKGTSETLETAAITGVDNLPYDKWIDIRFKARSQGLAGDTATVTKLYTIARPPRAQITKITLAGKNTGHMQVTVVFKPNNNKYHPVDSFTLQKLWNTQIKTIEMARVSNAWADVQDATSNGVCSGFVHNLSNETLERNSHFWYRIKSVRCGLEEYGEPFRAADLEKVGDAQLNDVVKIDSLTPGDEGALSVVLGWDNDDSNGTEVSWSEHEDAWKSTEQPSTYNVPDTWEDVNAQGNPSSQVTGKAHSASMTIRGLTEGVAYYVKARRYLDNGDKMLYAATYGTGTSEVYPITLVTALKKVYLYAPSYVSRGEGFRVNWTYDSDAEQTSWNLYRHVNGSKIVIHDGKDNLGSTAIEKELLEGADEVTLSVSVSIGNEHVESDQVTVNIVDKPSLAVVTDSLLQAQPMRFYAACDTSTVDLIVKVYSRGIASGMPYGEKVQTYGDVVWSEKISPNWYLNEDGLYYAIYVLPENLDFMDGGVYTLEAAAVSTETGLRSNEVEMNFEVDWLHQAHLPGSETAVFPNSTTMSTTIYVDKPDNWQSGDVYDIYRVSNDSVDLIADGLNYGTKVVDNWAPFGKSIALYYRIANRTKDGDVQWEDYVYDLYGHQLRFDWGAGESVDLPYNLELKSQYDKNYEMHTHLDGTTSGHWNPGFKKTDNFTTKLVRIEDNLVANKIRNLGEYPGPVFVRTPDGGAYQANVTISGIDNKYDDLLLGVTVKAERHSLTDIYRVQMNDVEVVEEQEAEQQELYARSQILAWSTDVPAAGDTYSLNEAPVGNVFKVELSTSYDHYMEAWQIDATYSGTTVTLGTFGSALDTYLAQTQTSAGTQYILKAYYNITE